MPTKKNRFMIVLNDDDLILLDKIKTLLNTKQNSKVISFLLRLYTNTYNSK